MLTIVHKFRLYIIRLVSGKYQHGLLIDGLCVCLKKVEFMRVEDLCKSNYTYHNYFVDTHSRLHRKKSPSSNEYGTIPLMTDDDCDISVDDDERQEQQFHMQNFCEITPSLQPGPTVYHPQ